MHQARAGQGRRLLERRGAASGAALQSEIRQRLWRADGIPAERRRAEAHRAVHRRGRQEEVRQADGCDAVGAGAARPRSARGGAVLDARGNLLAYRRQVEQLATHAAILGLLGELPIPVCLLPEIGGIFHGGPPSMKGDTTTITIAARRKAARFRWRDRYPIGVLLSRHGQAGRRPSPGHPRLAAAPLKTWMPGTRPAKTAERCRQGIEGVTWS